MRDKKNSTLPSEAHQDFMFLLEQPEISITYTVKQPKELIRLKTPSMGEMTVNNYSPEF